ncbi:hypothetical protein MKJ04_09970 [Pontibacter sp. E15-1]|uniref:hypothetical protein n=1 Tax=Pontibacter sp. E15-1 TaxID=2919918 RepID=UPI001F4F35E4|nr:hypothetical protein [Pontibacter sp. E15-1]MCJ8165168.1 hypothetical protein [Pontibacter sp. E15-1]
MKKLLFILLFIPLCLACKKEQIGEPLIQYHFINFVDASGQNLFESGKISTSNFYYESGDIKSTWEETMAYKKEILTPEVIKSTPTEYQDTVSAMLSNDNLLFEPWQGNLERERVIFINGAKHTFRYSLKEGFYQNGKKLQSKTDVIDEHNIYLHHIVLEEF